MAMKACGLVCLWWWGMLLPAVAQEHPRAVVDLAVWLQELMARPGSEDLNYEELYENLFQYYQHPLNLNQATAEELGSLFLLTPGQIADLLSYQQQNGPLLSIYELQAVPGLDLATIYKILPFVRVQEPASLAGGKTLKQRFFAGQQQYLLARWERVVQERAGFRGADSTGQRRYTGSPHKYQWRYRNSHARDYSLGLLLEKDAGEKFTWAPGTHRYGADFYSAHVQLYNRGRWKALALGDYQLQFGQGLLLAGGFQVGKGGETITSLRRSNLGLRPFTSVLETGFFRGAAFTFALQARWQLTGFYSRRQVDATGAGESDSLASFAGLPVSGLHRTATEIANKHRVTEQVSGGNLTFRHARRPLTLGLTGVFTHFDRAAAGSGRPYRHFDFRGKGNAAAGVHYSYSWQNVHFFGEAARSSAGGWGQVHGLMASLSKTVDAALLYRRYDPHFHAFYGYAFGENTSNRNERGWYTGIKIRPAQPWEITAYYDLFRFPWLRFRVDAPSRGHDYLVRVLFKPNRQVMLYGQLRGEVKGLNAPGAAGNLAQVVPARRRQYGLYLNYSPGEVWQWRARVQFTAYRHAGVAAPGYYLGQELSARLRKRRLTAGYGLFDTQDFGARQYVPEADVLLAFAVPMLHGTGSRTFLLFQQELRSRVDFWLKVSHNLYRYQQTVGSGLEQIAGPARTDIRCQLRYQL